MTDYYKATLQCGLLSCSSPTSPPELAWQWLELCTCEPNPWEHPPQSSCSWVFPETMMWGPFPLPAEDALSGRAVSNIEKQRHPKNRYARTNRYTGARRSSKGVSTKTHRLGKMLEPRTLLLWIDCYPQGPPPARPGTVYMVFPPRPLPLLPGMGKEAPGLQAFFSGSSVFSVCPHGICCEVLWAK